MLPVLPIALVGGFVAVVAIRGARITLAMRRLRDGVLARDHDMPRVASYALELEHELALLPVQAWKDLDMDEVFKRLDRTASWPGQHLLYARLRREDHTPEELRRFDADVVLLSDDEPLRSRVRQALRPLNERRASALPALFQGRIPQPPSFASLFPLFGLAVLGSLVAALAYPWLALVGAALVLVNVYLRVWLREPMERVLPAMRALHPLLEAARVIGEFDAPALATTAEALRRDLRRLRGLGGATRWAGFEPIGPNEFANMLYEYLNMLFLLDVNAYTWGVHAIMAERETLRRVYETLGELDVLQAVATLRSEPRPWSRPTFIGKTDRRLTVSAITHPMLDDPVPNALSIEGRSVLLTGSNMSGKSTFIRALGVNALLAQALHMVFGERWEGPWLRVRTSIGRSDSLLEGRSYYHAEVEAVGALLTPSTGLTRLVLIDELFRGTNSIERVAAARAVLAELDGGGDIVIVATHDVELLEMLPQYASYHFREEVSEGRLSFDYRLRAGPSSTRNALAILELAGYPPRVVAEATRTAVELERRLVRPL